MMLFFLDEKLIVNRLIRLIVIIRRSRQVLIFVLILIFFKFQLPELIRKIDAKGTIGYPAKAVQYQVLPGHGGCLVDIVGKGIGGRKGDTAFFVPDLFPERQVIRGKRRVFSLDLIPGRIEVTEKLQDERRTDLVSSIYIHPVVEAGDGAAAQGPRSDIPVERRKDWYGDSGFGAQGSTEPKIFRP